MELEVKREYSAELQRVREEGIEEGKQRIKDEKVGALRRARASAKLGEVAVFDQNPSSCWQEEELLQTELDTTEIREMLAVSEMGVHHIKEEMLASHEKIAVLEKERSAALTHHSDDDERDGCLIIARLMTHVMAV